VRHHRSDAYSAEQVLLNKRQIYGGAPKVNWYRVSYQIVSTTFESADISLQVQQLLTGRISQEIKERSRPVTRCARTPLIDHDTEWGWRAGSLNAHCNTAAVN